MATSPQEGEDPPPYITDNRNDADEVLQPAILILSGQYVRAQTADGAPLYELSRDVNGSSLGEARLAQVSLQRLIRHIKVNANGTPRVHQRNRHIFELKHLPPLMSTGFPYVLDAVSRHTIGNLALKAASFPRSGFKVVKIQPEKEDGFPKGYRARRESLKESEVVFEILKKRDHYEWMRPEDGTRIAVEDEMEGQQRLIVTASITRAMMDAMIASWCLRIWRDSIKGTREPRKPLDKEVRSAREVLPRWW